MRGTAAVAIRRTWVSDKACRGASTTAPAKPDGHSGAGLAACRARPDAVVPASLPITGHRSRLYYPSFASIYNVQS